MIFTEGTYKLLYIKKDDGEYYLIGCLSSNGFNESADILDTTTRDNADGWESGIPTKQRYNIPFNGVLFGGDGSSSISYKEIRTKKRTRTKIEWKIEDGKGVDVDYGFGYITNLSESADTGEYVSFTGTIIGFNKPLELECGDTVMSDVLECDIVE